MARAANPRPRRKTAGATGNAARGETTLLLGGKSYRLRPSYAAIVAIEDELGRSAIELLRASNAMALSYEDMGVIAAEFIRAGADEDDAMTRSIASDRIAELIFEEGSAAALVSLTVALASAVSGGRTASGEAKPVTTTG